MIKMYSAGFTNYKSKIIDWLKKKFNYSFTRLQITEIILLRDICVISTSLGRALPHICKKDTWKKIQDKFVLLGL